MGMAYRALALCTVAALLWGCTSDQTEGVAARRLDAGSTTAAPSGTVPASAAESSAGATSAPPSTSAATAPEKPLPLAPIVGTTWQFPLAVSDDHRSLVDAKGQRFRVNGDTGWEAPVELTLDEWRTYLDDRKAKGFNTILVQMTNPVASYPGSKAPAARGAGGALPFLRNAAGGVWDGDPQFAEDVGKHNPAPGNFDADFSSPNPVYWDLMAQMVEAANERNILLVLTVAYLGYNLGAQDGWWRTLNNDVNTREVSFGFGEFVGNRFKDYPNIIWEMGVDMLPPPGSEGEARALEILKGVKAAGDTHLWTGHWVHDVLATDSAAFEPFMDVEGVYTHGPYPKLGPTYGRARLAYERQPARPAILLETTYENEHDATRAQIRTFMWGGALSGSGVIFGTTPVWKFPPEWADALDTPSTSDMQALAGILDRVPWYALVPAGLDGVPDPIVKGHGKYTSMSNVGDGESGGMDWIVPAMTPGRQFFIAFVPDDHRGAFSLDMATFPAPTTVRWIDPTNGATIDAGRYENAGTLKLRTPSTNAGGGNDWVLVAEVP